MAAAAVHAATVVGLAGVVPLLMFLLYNEKSALVRYHALQALVFQVIAIGVVIVVALFTCGLGSVLLLPWFVLEIWLTIEAYQGRQTGYPGMAHLFSD